MTTVDDVSVIATPEASSILAAKNVPRGKNASMGKGKGAALKTEDVVFISQASKEKYAALAARTDEEGSVDVSANTSATQYKNQTKAIKAALQQIADETGVPMRGWAVGQYRKAFAASEGGDLSAMRGIYLARHGVAATPATPGTDTDPALPTDVEPGIDLEPGVDTEPGIDLEPGVDTEPGIDLETEIDTEPDPVADNETDDYTDLAAGTGGDIIPDLEEILYENSILA